MKLFRVLWILEFGCKASGNGLYFANGYCNAILNTAECHYDGGDCCLQRPTMSTNENYWYSDYWYSVS